VPGAGARHPEGLGLATGTVQRFKQAVQTVAGSPTTNLSLNATSDSAVGLKLDLAVWQAPPVMGNPQT
jgi:hypothetical protein